MITTIGEPLGDGWEHHIFSEQEIRELRELAEMIETEHANIDPDEDRILEIEIGIPLHKLAEFLTETYDVYCDMAESEIRTMVAAICEMFATQYLSDHEIEYDETISDAIGWWLPDKEDDDDTLEEE